MRMVYLVLLLLLVACGEESVTGQAVRGFDDTPNFDNIVDGDDQDNSITGLVAKDLIPRQRVDKDSPEYLESELKQVYAERADVLGEKREFLGLLNDPDVSFEEKQKHQDSLDVLRQRESELTLKARILESRIESSKRKEEGKEVVEAYNKLLDELKVKRQEYLEELTLLGEEILEKRKDLLDSGLSFEEFNSLKEELDPLEKEEESLRSKLADVLSDMEDKIETIKDYSEFSGDVEVLILERHRIEEELEVVKNSLVELYLNDGPEDRISDLKKQEDDLEDELREVNDRISDLS